LLYTGEFYDSQLAQYYLRARWYNPATGRFNRTDPFSGSSQDPQSLHKYLYAHCNPVNNTDPMGTCSLGEINLTALFQATMMALNVTGLLYNIRAGTQKAFEALNAFMQGDFWGGLPYVVMAGMHGTLAVLNGLGIRASLIAPPGGMAPALASAGGSSTAFWSAVTARPAVALWVIKQVAPVAFTAYVMLMARSGGTGASGGSGGIQEHHKVPYGSKKFNHQNHPLVKQAGINLEKHARNKMLLGNHGGRHSYKYHEQIDQMLWNAYGDVAGKGKDAAKSAFDSVCQKIERDIANGTLRPYNNKDVWVPPGG
jgi:RHS repeat-associated protein